MTTSSAHYLATLPAPVQERLVALVRATAGMSDGEKIDALAALNGCAEALFDFALRTNANNEALEFLATAGEVVRVMHRATEPEGEVA